MELQEVYLLLAKANPRLQAAYQVVRSHQYSIEQQIREIKKRAALIKQWRDLVMEQAALAKELESKLDPSKFEKQVEAILKDERVTGYRIVPAGPVFPDAHVVLFQTVPLGFATEESAYVLGPMEVGFCTAPGTGLTLRKNVKEKAYWDARPDIWKGRMAKVHPHSYFGSEWEADQETALFPRICWGRYRDPIAKAQEAQAYHTLIPIMLDFLENANQYDALVPVWEFPMVNDEGELFIPGQHYRHPMCPDCGRCVPCGLCDKCPGCKKHGCLVMSVHCGHERCKVCGGCEPCKQCGCHKSGNHTECEKCEECIDCGDCSCDPHEEHDVCSNCGQCWDCDGSCRCHDEEEESEEEEEPNDDE